MNIRTRVKLSFVFVVALLLFLGIISGLITYQIKENSIFREKVAAILLMQERMNEIINESTKVKAVAILDAQKQEFVLFEEKFEALRNELSLKKKQTLANALITNIRHNETIKRYLQELYENEHRIELMFDEIYRLEREKIGYMHRFEALYPEENRMRIGIQNHLLSHPSIEQMKALSDLRYYSKETLYQHSDEVTLNKWLSSIENLLQTNTIAGDAVAQDLAAYANVVKEIGSEAIRLEQTRQVEEKTLLRASAVLKENEKLSMAFETIISELSSGFIDKMRWIQWSVGFLTILFIIVLSIRVTRHVSLTMDEVEAKIEEGLKEVNALNDEIEDTQKEVLFTMGAIGETRSKETGNHVRRVAEYCKILALHYGLDEKESEMLKLASPMHDIGKVGIPDAVLNKPGRFDAAERVIMDTHAMLGYEMLKHSQRPLLKMAAIVAKEHHEKWDGTGYPDGKKAEEIHIYGRITALADVFDALGSARVYKPAWDDEKIFNLFKEERGKHFEPKLIDIFFENLEKFLHVRDSMKD